MDDSGENIVFRQLRNTLKRIGLANDREVAHLVTINIPAYAARRDAAYNRAAVLLRGVNFSMSEKRRSAAYDAVLNILDDAINATRMITNALPGGDGKSPFLHYMLLLKDTVNAAAALVKHEMILVEEEKELSSFIGGDVAGQFLSAGEIFGNSEMNIYNSIVELLDSAEPTVKRYQDYRRKTLSKSDGDRYGRSLKEFVVLYDRIGC